MIKKIENITIEYENKWKYEIGENAGLLKAIEIIEKYYNNRLNS